MSRRTHRYAFAALVLAALAPSAVAQTYQTAPNATLQVLRPNLLDGVWRVGGFGDLTLTTRPNGVLEGELAGKACHGQYLENSFAVLCESDGRGPVLISGAASETPPVATTARARILGAGARMVGQVHQTHLNRRGYTEAIGEFTADRR